MQLSIPKTDGVNVVLETRNRERESLVEKTGDDLSFTHFDVFFSRQFKQYGLVYTIFTNSCALVTVRYDQICVAAISLSLTHFLPFSKLIITEADKGSTGRVIAKSVLFAG